MDRHPPFDIPEAAPLPAAALWRRLAARIGPGAAIAHAPVTRLSGGRSATTLRLGAGVQARVLKITRAAPPVPAPDRDAGFRAGHSAGRPSGRGAGPDTAEDTAPDTRQDPAIGTGSRAALFPVDPWIEARARHALARRGLAQRPETVFRHGPDICLVYRYQPGRTGQPPGPGLARLLRRLHDLPTAALPFLPETHAAAHAALLTRALDRLRTEPDGTALVSRVAAARARDRAALGRAAVALHGDPVPGNVVRDGGRTRLIDWHSAQRGDPCHDIALALSPAMLVIHGLPPCTAARRDAFLAAYGCAATTVRFRATVALRHALMIGHCLWRWGQGDRAYGPALDAELAALRGLPPP